MMISDHMQASELNRANHSHERVELNSLLLYFVLRSPLTEKNVVFLNNTIALVIP